MAPRATDPSTKLGSISTLVGLVSDAAKSRLSSAFGTRRRVTEYNGLPSFLIIGAQRAGTTSLYSYLTRHHPQVLPATMKEVHFFDVHYQKGEAWYRNQLPSTREGDGIITGEASPYYLFHPLAAARAHAFVPDVKLIVLLRNPIDRALSHYHHETRLGRETLSFPEALQAEEERLKGEADRILTEPDYRSLAHQRHSYRARGCYMDQLEVWLRHFPRKNLMVILSERFYADPAQTLARVAEFLDLPPFPRGRSDYGVYNQANYSGMDAKLRDELTAFYRPHNERLSNFLGEDPGWV